MYLLVCLYTELPKSTKGHRKINPSQAVLGLDPVNRSSVVPFAQGYFFEGRGKWTLLCSVLFAFMNGQKQDSNLMSISLFWFNKSIYTVIIPNC